MSCYRQPPQSRVDYVSALSEARFQEHPGICWLEVPFRRGHRSWASIRSESEGAAYIDLTAKGMTVPFGRRHVVRNSRS
jgi:hypothetical protein